jgi:hypothetical protein
VAWHPDSGRQEHRFHAVFTDDGEVIGCTIVAPSG